MIVNCATSDFVTGSGLHLCCLFIIGLIVLGTIILGRRVKNESDTKLRALVAVGCLLVWIFNTSFFLMPSRFSWDQSLPLHLCNLANLVGAAAVWFGWRSFQAVLYFWSFALSIWALLTPSLLKGPGSVEFWTFWAYHVLIYVAITFVLVVDEFRPTWRDWRVAVSATLIYSSMIALIDRFTGWGYGFVGPGAPDQPTLLDVMGPYPLRLIWMGLIATLLFTLLMFPIFFNRRRRESPPPS